MTSKLFAPSMASDVRFREWMQRASRRAASPASARAYLTMTAAPTYASCSPQVRCPTLVLHRAQNRFMPRRLGRYLATRIPDAKFVLVPGDDHVPWTADADVLLDEIEEFLTGTPPRLRGSGAHHRPVHRHRRLDHARGRSSVTTPGAASSTPTMRSSARSSAGSAVGR